MRTNLVHQSTAVPDQAIAKPYVRLLLALFVLSLLIPSNWEVIGLRFSTARIYALCMVIPLAIRWLAQEAGRPLPVDILILLHGFWIIVTLAVHHGTERFALSFMTVIEVVCGYLVGRILIRDPASFRFLFKVLLLAIVIILPFALLEMSNGRALLQEIFRSILGSAHGDVEHPPRWGFYRAQTVMQHPILWGVFSAIVIANVFFIWRDRLPTAIVRAGAAGLACFSSMSAGAVLNFVTQVLLAGWGWMTKGAWKALMIIFVVVFVFLSFASNRGPIIILIETMTFNAGTGWSRIYMWRYGIDDVMNNPIFGIGLNDWTRPYWLTGSVDNFWLVMMLRHGFVGFGLLAAGISWHIWKVVRAEGLSAYERRLREGYVIALASLIFSLTTVHFWGPPYLLMFAYIGAGVWFYAGREDVSAMVTPASGDVDEDVPSGSKEVWARNLPFARSFVGVETRRHDLERVPSSSSSDDTLPLSLGARATPRNFSRWDIDTERKTP
jgi:hypothetical protein